MAQNEKCKKCGLPLKEGLCVTEWCVCEIGIDIDENGEPLESCKEHGVYSGGGPCPGCEAAEDAVDRAIERDHERGNIKW